MCERVSDEEHLIEEESVALRTLFHFLPFSSKFVAIFMYVCICVYNNLIKEIFKPLLNDSFFSITYICGKNTPRMWKKLQTICQNKIMEHHFSHFSLLRQVSAINKSKFSIKKFLFHFQVNLFPLDFFSVLGGYVLNSSQFVNKNQIT